MKHNDLLIVFVDNPILKRINTGLVNDLGLEAAEILQEKIIEYTCDVASKVSFVDIAVYYSNIPTKNDCWGRIGAKKFTQRGDSIQNRIKYAFYDNFNLGYKRIVMIGSNCLDITEQSINKAFDLLYSGNCILGPTDDGSLYLTGLNYPFPHFFMHNKWDTKELLKVSMESLQNINVKFIVFDKVSLVKSLADVEPHYEKLAHLSNAYELHADLH